MLPPRVRQAVLLAFLVHGLFIVTARYRASYDAYTHMLFADHYAQHWFSLWEPRWYTGFPVVSYPPLAHQLTALLIPVFGFDAAYALILWGVASLYPAGVYAFTRIFTGRAAAGWAALASALLLPIYVTAHVFGQLPFLTGTLASLFGAAALARTLREGGGLTLILAVSLAGTTMAAHHATLLFQPFLIGAVILCRPAGQTWIRRLTRGISYALPAIAAGLLVIWPFWRWGLGQTMQTPIDHPSRHNFLTDPMAFAIFFLPMYGPLVAVMPAVLFRKWPKSFTGLILSFAMLLLLGLGGTTPLPRWLFGEQWQWLTYDRFAFWASLCLLPFFGWLFVSLRRRLGTRSIGWRGRTLRMRRVLAVTILALFGGTALITWLTPILLPLQPRAIDMNPIVDFLEQDGRSDWRYLTFGFGDQYVHLNLLTRATTIDGTYHTARSLPELRSSGVGQIDTAMWLPHGLDLVEPILIASGEYGVRWGFVNHNDYVPALRKSGWKFLGYLPNGLRVWENPAALKPTPAPPLPASPLETYSWGLLPLFSLVTSAALGALRLWPGRSRVVLQGVHSFLVGLIPAGLCFWYFIVLADFPHDRVYFTYASVILYLVDALVILAVLAWLVSRLQPPFVSPAMPPERTSLYQRVSFWVFLFCLLPSLSILWSRDPRLTAFVALHFWLMLGLFLSLRDWPGALRSAAIGLCAALAIQAYAGVFELATQSTAFLTPFGLEWPGVLDASVRGASILRTTGGGTFLRLYGTLPHPNLLGSFLLVFLAGPAILFLRKNRPNHSALLLFALGAALIGLAFSRAAWLGALASGSILLWKSGVLDRKRLTVLLLTGLLTLILVLIPLRDFVFARVSNASVRTEQLSIESRVWLSGQALRMIQAHPLLGVGAGMFLLELARQAGPEIPLEPVHNLPLLILAETGLPGLIVMIGLLVTLARSIARSKRPEAILLGAALAGLAVTGLFDHNLWTLSPGRVLMFLILGLWAGQTRFDSPQSSGDL